MSFMPTSLDQLTQDLKNKDVSKFVHTKSLDEQNTGLLLRKGVFPYEYIKDLSVLKETKLPSKEDFFSTLKNEGITDAEYLHAQEVWTTFKCISKTALLLNSNAQNWHLKLPFICGPIFKLNEIMKLNGLTKTKFVIMGHFCGDF